MKNMTFKEKFLFIFLQIITLGLIWLWWSSKTKKVSKENELSISEKINVNVNELISNLGGNSNIVSASSTHTKVKIEYKERNIINIENIKNIKGISGVFINDNSITVIVGNQAKLISDEINNKNKLI